MTGAIAFLVFAFHLSAASPGIWIDVPFVRQVKNGCGAASIAMILQYWGERSEAADPGRIHQRTYSLDAEGTYASSMERYFNEHGFRAFAFRGTWTDLRSHLEKGRPLIVCLKLDKATRHYVVVAGAGESFISINDPAGRKLRKLDRAGFEKQWSGSENWTLLALPHRNP
ncbi:MAG: cysteine peptidase family C39 domain-containing protein [Bryobacteraceae bacterium]